MGRRSNKTGLKGIAAVAMLSLIFSADAAAALNDAPLSGMIDGSNAAPSVEADPDAATSSTAKKKEDEDFPAVTEEKKDVISRTMTEKSAVSVRYPIAAGTEGSPFDFFLDPCGLIEGTEAMRYGEGRVEEGATLLFYNRNGEYDFSKESDKLTVLTLEPVEITVSAYLSELGELAVMEDRDFSGSDICGMYLALVDDRGNEQPLSADGEAFLSLSLEPGSYSFGLTGACNSDADWQDISIRPKVTVIWSVE